MEKETKTAGEMKIDEYASRVAAGEPLESILDGLPPAMRQAVEAKVNSQKESPMEDNPDDLRLPSKYDGLPAEIVEDLWTIPIYADPEKTKIERGKKERILEALRQKEIEKEVGDENKTLKRADDQARISQIQAELGMQPKQESKLASPEQLSAMESMSVEDFAVWLIEEAKKNGKQLGQTSAYDALTARPEFRTLRIASAFGDTKPLMEVFHQNEAAIRQFKEDAETKVKAVEGVEYVPGTWDHYKIQYEKRERKETHKGYVTIDKDQVLTEFTPDVRHEIVKRLRDGGYRGQVKFPVTGSRALFSYDNIVLHGNEPDDVGKGLEIVQDTLNDHHLKYESPRRGVDAEGSDGKKTSYTDRIAQLVEQASKDPNTDLNAEIKKLKGTEEAVSSVPEGEQEKAEETEIEPEAKAVEIPEPPQLEQPIPQEAQEEAPIPVPEQPQNENIPFRPEQKFEAAIPKIDEYMTLANNFAMYVDRQKPGVNDPELQRRKEELISKITEITEAVEGVLPLLDTGVPNMVLVNNTKLLKESAEAFIEGKYAGSYGEKLNNRNEDFARFARSVGFTAKMIAGVYQRRNSR